jgi:hypothetical protein
MLYIANEDLYLQGYELSMKAAGAYERYPAWIVLVSNLVSIATYLAGAFIIYQVGIIWMVLYLAYVGFLEMRLLKGHCADCYYYGRMCAFGQGKLSSLLFKKGDPKKFCKKQMTWKDIAPDFMVSLVPMATGAALLVMGFSWIILGLVILLFVLGFPGNAFVRGSLACRHCRQRELGCPAEKMFKKK